MKKAIHLSTDSKNLIEILDKMNDNRF
jgi:hypothetical protein